MLTARRLLVVSNRLPITIGKVGKQYRMEPSSGGLITALRPIICAQQGSWVGWTGSPRNGEVEKLFTSAAAQNGVRLFPVFLTDEERMQFYCGFCNEIIWPLFHDLQSRCNFDPGYWQAYVGVNRKFAEAVVPASADTDVIWVHDYHLILQASLLRALGVKTELAYFHHIPFPSPDIFEKMPWRLEILSSLLNFNLIGFQTRRDQRNFLACVRRFLPNAVLRHSIDQVRVSVGNNDALVGSFPVGINFADFAQEAIQESVVARAEELRNALSGCRILLGVDRLDYTKGIPERLKAFRALLCSSPEFHRRVALVQVVVPSRGDIPRYRELKLEVERLVSDINGCYGSPEWVPVHYIHRHLPQSELVACYRAADIALVTPLRDGMNLVAKEFCAAHVDGDGVLILSEFAGAASQLGGGALLVNPYDVKAVAHAVSTAIRMSPLERRTRMMRLRENVQREDVLHWFHSCLPQRSFRRAAY